MGYVYKITNTINNKVYIGITRYKNPKCRFYKHLMEYKCAGKFSKRPLYEAMQKYGSKNFKFTVIEEVSDTLLSEREKYWIKYYNSFIGFSNSNGYNATLGGDGGHASLIPTEIDAIIKLYIKGYSIRHIMQITHHTYKTIKYYLTGYEVNQKFVKNKRVCQLDKENKVIAIFDSIAEANSAMGGYRKSGKISEVCKGLRKTAYGYSWKLEN